MDFTLCVPWIMLYSIYYPQKRTKLKYCNIAFVAPSNAMIRKARESRLDTFPCEKETEHSRHLWEQLRQRRTYEKDMCGLQERHSAGGQSFLR